MIMKNLNIVKSSESQATRTPSRRRRFDAVTATAPRAADSCSVAVCYIHCCITYILWNIMKQPSLHNIKRVQWCVLT